MAANYSHGIFNRAFSKNLFFCSTFTLISLCCRKLYLVADRDYSSGVAKVFENTLLLLPLRIANAIRKLVLSAFTFIFILPFAKT
jgi:hypothetical protein